MKNIIHIYGASGSGTSTLGEKISKEFGYKQMDTDDYFWLPTDPKFIKIRDRDERIELMREDIKDHKNIVISGSLTGWGDVLIPLFTLVVRLVIDPKERIERLEAREKMRFGSRIEPGGDMYLQHLEFIEWAKKYDTAGPEMRSKAEHDEWQKLLRCKQIVLDGAAPLEDNLAIIKENI